MVRHRLQSGFAYLAVLFLVVAISISMGIVAQNEDTLLKREKEQDWLFTGKQYQRAIASYYNQPPDGIKKLPSQVEDLLQDKRFIAPVRHLRKMYSDPLNNQQAWVLILNQQNQITGVYSQSKAEILSTKIITEYQENLGDEITNYTDVKFLFKPPETSNDEPSGEIVEP
jgi:predicted oxidoreductase